MAGIVIEGLDELIAAAERLGPELDHELRDGLTDSARFVGQSVEAIAPRRSGRLVGSVVVEGEGTAAEVRVTARASSARYPSYPYPGRVDRARPFMAPAVRQALPKVEKRLTEVLDDVARKWGGA